MALVAISNSLRGLSCADKRHSVALSFDPLNSISSSTGSASGSVRSGDCCSTGRVSRGAFSRRTWPSSESRRATCVVSPNASSTPESQTADKETAKGPSVLSHLELLQKITSESNLGASGLGKTIAQQLAEDRETEDADQATIPLGSGKLDIKSTDLTISQKRNIRRQNYMNKVAKRDDAPFFTAVALFVLVPPAAILGLAVATGYVDLFP